MMLHDAILRYCDLHLSSLRSGAVAIRFVKRHLLTLPNLPLEHVDRLDHVIPWFRGIGVRHEVAANKALQHLSVLFGKMILWGEHKGSNPAQYIAPYERPKRAVIIPQSHIKRVVEALLKRPLEIRLYFLTTMICGNRRDELRCAKWEHFNLETGQWTIPIPKNGDPHRLTLPLDLLVFYREYRREGREPYIFSITGEAPLATTSIFRYWVSIRTEADLPHVRIHDLRRTMISYFCNEGKKEIAQRIANHRSIKTTERYAVYGDMPIVTEALAAYARRIMGVTDCTAIPPNEGVHQEEGRA